MVVGERAVAREGYEIADIFPVEVCSVVVGHGDMGRIVTQIAGDVESMSNERSPKAYRLFIPLRQIPDVPAA